MYQQLFQTLPDIAKFLGAVLVRKFHEPLHQECQRVFGFTPNGELSKANIDQIQEDVRSWAKRYDVAVQLKVALSTAKEEVRPHAFKDVEFELEKAEFMLTSYLELADKLFKHFLPTKAEAHMARLQHLAWPSRPIHIKAALAKAS